MKVKAMRINSGITSFMLILIFLNLTTGCFYYKVYTKTEPAPEDIRWEDFNGKYFIMHFGNSAWQMNNISVDTNLLHCAISTLPDNHKKYLLTDVKKTNRFIHQKAGYQGEVLNEVHLYSSEPIHQADTNISVNFSSLERMEIYYFDERSTAASIIIPSATIPFTVVGLIGLIILLTKSSCPYVYIMEGDTFNFTGEIYSGAIYASLERNDYLPLPGFMPNHDKYTVKIANKLPEIQYLNQAKLWVVDHPENTEVIADKNGTIHTLQSLQAPVTAISEGKADLSGLLAEEDQQFFLFNEEPSLTGDTMAKNSVELTFRVPAGQITGKLVVNAKNSNWGDYIFGEFTKYFGYKYPAWIRKQSKMPPERPIGWKKDQSLVLMVYLETSDGWQFVDYFDMAGPLAFRNMVMPMDMSNGIKNLNDSVSQVNIKIETGFMFWELDYAAMDFTKDVPMNIEIISPSSAINESGKDVDKLIAGDDRKYYIQPSPGDEVILDFKCPPGQHEMKRSIVLHTKGYYEHLRYYPNPPEWEKLEAFRRPGRLSEFSLEHFLDAKRNISMKSSRDNR